MKEPKISIIVPIYNVEKYLSECVQSLCNQSLIDIEILLVDDGSTDGSGHICDKLAKEDTRIKVFHKNNEGLGPTRNYGIEHAKGKYLMFVDSDDWLRLDSAELLYEKAEREQLDIVYFDFVEYRQNENRYIRNYENYNYLGCKDFVKTKLQNCVLPSSCTSMFRLSKWREKQLMFPSTLFEDNGLYPLFLLEFKKYAIIPEGLYFYRKNHAVTATSKFEDYSFRCLPLEYLIKELQQRNYFEVYKEDIYLYCCNQLVSSLYYIKKELEYKDYLRELGEFNFFLEQYFGHKQALKDNECFYLGSYNIGRIGNCISRQDINKCRYNFVSLISLMSDKPEHLELGSDNEYKNLMFRKETSGELLHSLKQNRHKYLIFDLLEERHPIVHLHSGGLYTGTKEFIELLETEENYGLIMLGEEKHKRLWEQSCLKFINFCRQNFDLAHLIMVRTLLSDTYGNEGKLSFFDNKSEIDKINEYLSGYYDFFAENCPEVFDITVDREDYYTASDFKYGCVPEHLNNDFYRKAAKLIVDKVGLNV